MDSGLMEYGLLVYDIPSSEKKLYGKIRKAIKGKCLRINLSVYLIPWAQKAQMESIIAEAGGQNYATLTKFDSSESEQLEVVAKRCLQEQTSKVLKSLQAEVDASVQKYAHVYRAKENLAEAQAIALLFGFQPDVTALFDACKNLLSALVTSRYVKDPSQAIIPFGTPVPVVEEASAPLALAA